MADKLKAGQKSQKNEFVRAFIDLIILGLLLVGAGFGGYWYGMHERVVPVEWVPKGTADAVSQKDLEKNPGNSANDKSKNKTPTSATQSSKSHTPQQNSQLKYWLTSQGTDYIGYSVTVSINGDQVDSFFGPGKIVDISNKVKKGDNTILFEAKNLGEEYNKHPGDKKAELSVKLVSGPKISEDYNNKNVKIQYKRNASEHTDFQDTKHFKAN